MTSGSIGPFDLPAAAAWRDSLTPTPDTGAVEPVNYLAYLAYEVGLDRAFAVMRLLFPQFEVVRGCVLMKGTGSYTPDSFEQWWAHFDGDIGAVEGMLNHLQLWDVFTQMDHTLLAEEALAELGKVMAKTWKLALLEAFPDREFLVEFHNDPGDYGPMVTFRSAS